jgi:hypothetical protein
VVSRKKNMLFKFVLLAAVVVADQTDFVAPRVGAVNSRNQGGTTGPGPGDTKFLVCDGQSAFVHLDGNTPLSYYFEYSDFNFTGIPPGATFLGFEIDLTLSLVQVGVGQPIVQAMALEVGFDGQLLLFPGQTANIDGSPPYRLGGATVGPMRFGDSMTTDRIKRSQRVNFRFQVPSGAPVRQIYLDCIRMRIFYTQPSTTTTTTTTTTTVATTTTTSIATMTPTSPVPLGTPPATPTPAGQPGTSSPTTGASEATSTGGTQPEPPLTTQTTATTRTADQSSPPTTTLAADVRTDSDGAKPAPESSSGIEWWVWVVVGVVVLAVAGAVGVFLWRRRAMAAWPSSRSADTVYKWDDGSSDISMTPEVKN